MYTVCNPNLMIAQPQQQVTPPGQVYYTTMPTMPTYYVNGAPTPLPFGQGQPVFYQPQVPGWYSIPQTSISSTSDDVFIHDSASSEPSMCDVISAPVKTTRVVECQTDESCFKRKRKSSKSRTRRKLADTSLPDSSSNASPSSDNSLSNSGSSSPASSSPGQQSILDASRPPFISAKQPNALQHRLNNDLTLYDVFSASLCSAITEDPPNPTPSSNKMKAPKTSSPIAEEQGGSCLINVDALEHSRGRLLTSVSSERSLRFSQNGYEVDMDHGQFMATQHSALDMQDPLQTRREDFLNILEQEREKQKKCALPRYAPKMNCKFCKNNGEPPEVYTKHRLHFNEKTVCPLLRHYVCRLCNSTGDFAHTIKHCPFNSRYDKIAWKATFL